MVRTVELGFVLGTALLGWLVAVTVTGGWSEPPVVVWAAVLAVGGAVAVYAADAVQLGA